MTASTLTSPHDDISPLAQTLEKTEAVTADVHNASQQLAVVATVLEKNVPQEVQVGDLAQAIDHTEELEKKLAESARALVEVSTALEHEIEKRAEFSGHPDNAKEAARTWGQPSR
ncbi:MAG: hypothetical protein JWQ03_402 [Variovorax sp.]|nr:hypothetical protein [Variovorax sp.]